MLLTWMKNYTTTELREGENVLSHIGLTNHNMWVINLELKTANLLERLKMGLIQLVLIYDTHHIVS
jgi:hypothetical protein